MNQQMGLTVVIPAYNRSNFIRKCLLSVSELKHRPLEVLVVDDGSEDDTVKVAKSFGSTFDAKEIIFAVIEIAHSGAQVARNIGAQKSRFQKLLFLDSDDFLDPDGLDAVLAESEKRNDEITIGRVDHVSECGSTFETIGTEWTPGDSNRVLNYDWHTSGAIYDKSFLVRIGGWAEVLAGSQDWELQVRAKANATKVSFSNTRIAYWLSHSGSRVGAVHYRFAYTESVLIACGLNLSTLTERNLATWHNQLKLAAKVALHLREMYQHGLDHRKVWLDLREHFPAQPPVFRFGLNLPWASLMRLRRHSGFEHESRKLRTKSQS